MQYRADLENLREGRYTPQGFVSAALDALESYEVKAEPHETLEAVIVLDRVPSPRVKFDLLAKGIGLKMY